MRAVWRSVLLVFSIFVANSGAFAPAFANSKYAAVVIQADSGNVLFDRHADEMRYPASLTKMMTLYLLFEELDAGRLTIDSPLTISGQAAAQPPSKLGLEVGSTITVEQAIQALVVKSANDVAVVVAEAISGTEWRFAQRMTEKARALGMSRTTFRNASGLPNSKQRTTARDLATLGKRLMQDFPHYYAYFSTPDFTWNGRTYRTHNAMVRTYEGANGLKTGYTRVSGFNLATSASRDGQRLIGVVLGGRSVRTRDSHMRDILDSTFAALKTDPMLVASLYRETPTPRLKPTLVAGMPQQAPTIAASEEMREEITVAAAGFGPASDDTIALLAATALQGDFNEYERVRLASNASDMSETTIGEGDLDDSSATTWSVQIGAYSSKELAQRELEKAAEAGRLLDRVRNVQPMDTADGQLLYRARLTAQSAQDAHLMCAALQARKRSCFVVADSAAR
jgi:D-alanyl-D-alanine carboxypeptidase